MISRQTSFIRPKKTGYRLAGAFLIAALVISATGIKPAHAGVFTEASMRLDRMKVSVLDNDILVVIKPATVGTEAKVKVTFSGGFAVDSTASNITTTTTGIPSTYQGETLVALPGIGATASAVSGQVVTVTSSDLTVGTLYGYLITAGIDNPGSPASDLNQTITSTTSGDVTVDSSRVAVAVISDDQIVVTAVVPATFSFSLGANSTSFTTDLSSAGIVSTTGVTVTVATNAANGWIAWLKSANTALSSATTGESIATSGTVNDACTTLSAGSDFYQLDVDLTTDHGTGDGTLSIDSEYNCATTSGGTYSTTYEEIARSTGTTAGDVITLIGRATITAVKAAATDYTDTWTVIGAGNF